MKLTKGELMSIVLTLVAIGVGIYFYPMLPERVASHWGVNGEVNGYMPRFWGAFLLPVVFAFLSALFIVIPRIDPKKENIKKFRGYFDAFIVAIFLFLSYIYALSLAWNTGSRFNMTQYMAPALGALFICAGVLISKAEPNWTIGIRTPWTLSSETVWKKTHALSGTLFKISGIIAVLGAVFPEYAFILIIIPIIISAVTGLIYSYFAYKAEQ